MGRLATWLVSGVLQLAIVMASTPTGATAPDAPMPPEMAKDRLPYVTHLCWEGEDLEGHPISETEMKVACITAGVLIARLMDAGYCLFPREDEWKRC